MTRGEIPIQCIIVAMILELRGNVFGVCEEQMDYFWHWPHFVKLCGLLILWSIHICVGDFDDISG